MGKARRTFSLFKLHYATLTKQPFPAFKSLQISSRMYTFEYTINIMLRDHIWEGKTIT